VFIGSQQNYYWHQPKCQYLCVKKAPAPDDEELVSLSKRLVEDAVLRAVQQYMEETQQNGAAPRDQAPPGAASKLNTTK
uniref:A kinase (PRKA) anchor protein 7 n=1 Tax=Sinocyclocheilus anshuiensis TaxID=1608454 RepID=A0A671SV56_9TELE